MAYWNSIPRGIISDRGSSRGNCLHANLINIPREQEARISELPRLHFVWTRHCRFVRVHMYVQYLATFAWRRKFTTDRCQTIAVARNPLSCAIWKFPLSPLLSHEMKKIVKLVSLIPALHYSIACKYPEILKFLLTLAQRN